MAEKKTRLEPGTMPTSVRMSPKGIRLWEALSVEMGLSKTGVIETAIRELARQRGVTDEEANEKK